MNVRMYRQGLGDCFLLSLPRSTSRSSGEGVHVLIDCGVLIGTKDAATRMQAVARDIGERTGGRIDVVVGTHEHWDHLSGFNDARSEFEKIEFGEVWLGWTEDLADSQARSLSRARARRVRALAGAAKKLVDRRLSGAPAFVSTGASLAFFGIEVRDTDLAERIYARKAALGTRDALDYLLDRGAASRLHFQEPGTHFLVPGTDDVRVYVLGPPRDELLLRKDRPSQRDPEGYHELALSPEACFLSALDRAEGTVSAGGSPFDDFYVLKSADARSNSFFETHYGFGANDENAWRRIDDAWLGTAGQLALALDNDTNNTSLVMAFELGAGGPVLLFAADAQIGNWQGWHKLRFRVGRGADARTVTADDLLARTVLYKVGHHGSHNATLRDQGLEKMTHKELRALIPVSTEMAKVRQWRMPFPPLLKRLNQRCRDRVVASDAPPTGSWLSVDELAVNVPIPAE